MIDLTRQIEAYAEQLDLAVPTAAELYDRRRLGPPRGRRRPRRWAAAAALVGAAAAVVIAVGIVALTRGGGDVAGTTAPTVTSPPSTTSTTVASSILRFELATDTPAFDTGPAEAWDWPYVSPGAVIPRDGVYHMLRNGFGDEKPTGVGYGVSEAGVTWSPVGTDPVFTLEGGQVHTGLVTGAGTWIVYFDAVDQDGSEPIGSIGRATAPGPQGPWQLDASAVLEPGGVGAWDDASVRQPAVVAIDGGFVMFYVGVGDDGSAIGRATSDDGIEWRKDARPVLIPEADWEGGALSRPDVVVTEDGLVMLYGNRSGSRRGVATSPDGVGWTRFAGNPVLDTQSVPRATIRTGELVYHDGRYLLYLETGGSVSGTQIVVLTRDQPIPIR